MKVRIKKKSSASFYTVQKIKTVFLILSVLFIYKKTQAQTIVSWTNTAGSTAWLTASNWSAGAYPTAGNLAQFNNSGTASTSGINMNTLAGALSISGIEVTNLRVTNNLLIGNSSTVNGTLTLTGGNINAVPNAIVRNGSSKNLTIQDVSGGTALMGIVLGNTTDNKIILDGSGNITVANIISGPSTNSLTVQGAGSGVVNITGVANTYSGTINLLGVETVFSADGSFGTIPSVVTPGAIIIDGGRMTANATYTLNSNRGIQVGTTAGTSISVKTGASILTYNGVISDKTTNGFLAKQGGNVLQLGGVSVYTGSTSINNGTIRLINGSDRLPVTTTLNIGQAASANVGTLDLNGFTQHVAGLNSIIGTNASAAKNTVTATTSSTLDINAVGNFTYGVGTASNSGIIVGATSIIKNGSGVQVLGDINSYTGETIINAGELRFSPNANESLNSSTVTVNGGILGTQGITANTMLSFSSLNLTDNSIINLESANAHTVNFSGSSANVWTASKTLTITGWQGIYNSPSGSPGTVGRIFIGLTSTDLTSTQLSQITFFDGTLYYAGTLLSTGELVPYCISPVINTAIGNSPCVGSTLNFSVTASTTVSPSYSWVGPNAFTSSNQNPSISNVTSAAAGIYSLTINDGCGVATSTTAVSINVLPVITVNSATVCAGGNATLIANGANTYTWNTASNSATIVVTPSSSTNYTVDATSAQGCINSATTSVIITGVPSISVNSATICSGASATLNATGVSTYTWSTGSNSASITLNPSVTTTYTISGIALGCPVTATNTATIIVNATPTVVLNSLAGPVCINSSTLALTGTPAGGNFSGPGVSANIFSPSTAGAGTFTISYSYTNTSNCSSADSKTISVNLCTGINGVSQNNFFNVYPNPVQSELNVNIENKSLPCSVSIYSVDGKLLYSENVTENTVKIDAGNYKAGLYMIRISTSDKQSVIKFIKD